MSGVCVHVWCVRARVFVVSVRRVHTMLVFIGRLNS